jgi:hypothetical protein
MNRKSETYVVIKSTKKSERDNLYLLKLYKELFVNRYKIIYDLYEAHALSASSYWELATFVDNLFKRKKSRIIPASKSDYDNFLSKSSLESAIPCFFVEVDGKKIHITYTYGESVNHTLFNWIKIADIFKELDSIVWDMYVFDDNNCPCLKCIVQATCVVKEYMLNDGSVLVDADLSLSDEIVIDVLRKASNACPDFDDWKRDRFLELWKTLPNDIKRLEYRNYKEMLLKSSN